MQVVEGTVDVADVDAFVSDCSAIGERHGVAIQAFDARYVAGRAHLERAVAMADRAFARDYAIARDRAVEILLYAAGRRQIDRALAMGVEEGEGPLVVVVHSPEDGGDAEAQAAGDVRELLLGEQSTLGDYDEELVTDFFDIGPKERAATDATLTDLVCERVALLAVEK